MYDDMVKQHGLLWLYGYSIFFVLPPLLPELIKMWKITSISALLPF